MSPRLERLYLAAITSGWHGDWRRYYVAEEAERQARLDALAFLPESDPKPEED